MMILISFILRVNTMQKALKKTRFIIERPEYFNLFKAINANHYKNNYITFYNRLNNEKINYIISIVVFSRMFSSYL